MWFHREGPRPKEEQELPVKERNEINFQTQKSLVDKGRSHGILIYEGDDPIGWCQYGLKDEFPRIDNGPGYRKLSLDDGTKRLWRITCFCVEKKHRNQGVAKACLRAALSSIRAQGGGIVEAFPTNQKTTLTAHRGTVTMFGNERFTKVVPFGRKNVIMRRKV
ncbi:MAG TPA: GNAT family N-acetyltransferase [Nitrososphaerales archaeon]|nr:GNAT family N-acetyltransferase [Nitrososphaerales archaeon]